MGLFILFLISAALSLLFFYQKRSKAGGLLLVLALFFLALGLIARFRFFYVLVFDVGKGNAILVHLPGDRNLLFDAGARYGKADLGKILLVPTLRRMGIRELDLVVLSHPDLDHTGGLPALFRAFPVKKLLSGAFKAKDWAKLEFELEPQTVTAPKALSLEPASLFLEPGRAYPENLNRESLMAFLEYQGLTVFFPGDADALRLARAQAKGLLFPSEVFILPHHGSKTGYWPPAWEILRFKVAVASARGRFHPHPRIKDLLKKAGRPFYSTAETGALMIFLKGSQFLVCPKRTRFEGLPFDLFWPYIPYINLQGCSSYALHRL